MSIFKKIKDTLFQKEEDKTEIEKKVDENPEKFASATIENTLICNSCGKEIEGTPRFFKMGDRRLIFHKGCFKRLRHGQLPS
jgi:hypothetical protein